MEIRMTDVSDTVSITEKVFDVAFNEPLIHQIVVAYQAGSRSGTKAQKTRSEVSGGGAKPWKQKGTGRARAGTIRSPIWRTGGVTFAAKPRNHSQKINRKMYKSALRSIFSEVIRQGNLRIVESLEFSSYKTKDFVQYLRSYKLESDLLIISETANDKVYMASRNLPTVTVIDVQAINPVLLLRHKGIIVDRAAIKKIDEWLS